jgi:hypothetical protein
MRQNFPGEKIMDRFRYDSLTRLADYVLDYENSYYENMGITIPHDKIPGEIDTENFEPGSKIFIKVDLLNHYAEFLSKMPVPFHLMTGRAAKSPSTSDIESILKNKNVVSWVGTNIPTLEDRIMQVPIGFQEEGLERPNGSFPFPELKEKTNDIVLTYIGDTHESRKDIPKDLDISFVEQKEDYGQYLYQLNTSKYSICPRGYGIDTHRVYESIVMNSIPIVLTSILDPLYNSINCIILDSWDDIKNELSEKTLNREQVTFDYWRKEIEKFQNDRL